MKTAFDPEEVHGPVRVDAADIARVRRWALFAVVVLVSAFAVWLTSPRFAVEGPSFVDDWAAIDRSQDQVASLVRFENPEPERFRPAWILWNYVQWHTLDAPQGLVGPNFWNVLRVLVLVAGLSLLTALMLPPSTDRREALLHAGLAGLPALLVFTVPKFARDVTWFGPQEPLLIGGLALGGSLIALAAASLLDNGRPLPRFRIAFLCGTGSVLWLLGAYQKEASVCALPLIAALLVVNRHRLSSWKELSSGRRTLLIAIGAVVAISLAHVALEIVRIAARGDIVYGAEVDSGGGIVRGLRILYDWSHEALPLTARYVMVGAVVLTALAAIVRRRVDAFALAALTSGALTLVFAAQSGVAVSRYYIPAYALFAVALCLSLARFPQVVQATGLLLVFFAFMPPSEPRDEVRRWADEENQGAALVQAVAELNASGCAVAVDGLDLETSLALPVLVGLDRDPASRDCAQRAAYLVLPPYAEGVALSEVCALDRLEPMIVGRLANLYECGELRAEPVRDKSLGLVAPRELVELRRFSPAS